MPSAAMRAGVPRPALLDGWARLGQGRQSRLPALAAPAAGRRRCHWRDRGGGAVSPVPSRSRPGGRHRSRRDPRQPGKDWTPPRFPEPTWCRRLHARDRDRYGGVFRECSQVDRVTGEDDRARLCAGEGDDHRIDSGDASGAPGCRAQTGRFAGLHLIHLADLTGLEQTVGVKIATMVPSQCLREDYCRHLRRPHPSPAQLLKTGSPAGQLAQTTGIEHQGHTVCTAPLESTSPGSPSR